MLKHISLLCILTISPTLATIRFVEPGQSIQDAVLQSTNSDTVIIEDGHYMETVIPYGRTLTIGSRYLIDGDTLHISSTVIAPDFARPDTGSCFVFAYGEDVGSRLVGLTLRDGTGTVWSSTDWPAGGAVYNMSALSLEHCVILNSTAAHGGGIAFLDTMHTPTSQGSIRNCLIQDCAALDYGGGLWADYCISLSLDSCIFENNDAGVAGGGVYVSFSDALMSNCRIANNTGGIGGVLWTRSGMIRDCIFEGNISTEGPCSHLNASGEQSIITRCIFRNTVTPYIAVLLYSPSGGQDVPHFYGNVVENNTTT
jgi:hypothetical protein